VSNTSSRLINKINPLCFTRVIYDGIDKIVALHLDELEFRMVLVGEKKPYKGETLTNSTHICL
jgi:hypothetical protein